MASLIKNMFPADKVVSAADQWINMSTYLGHRDVVQTFQCHAQAFVEYFDLKDYGLEILYIPAEPFTQAMQKNFYVSWRESNLPKPILPFMWHKIDSRLIQKPRAMTLKNLDRRLAYRWKNIYLVKAYFTFGIVKTGPQHVDLIQTHAAPLILAVPKHPERFETARVGHFYSTRQHEFDKRVLEAHSVYIIPENTTYVLLTTQKSCFAVDRCESVRVARDISRRVMIKNINHVPVFASSEKRPEKFFPHKTLRKDLDLQDEPPLKRMKSSVTVRPISAGMAKWANADDPLQTLLDDLNITPDTEERVEDLVRREAEPLPVLTNDVFENVSVFWPDGEGVVTADQIYSAVTSNDASALVVENVSDAYRECVVTADQRYSAVTNNDFSPVVAENVSESYRESVVTVDQRYSAVTNNDVSPVVVENVSESYRESVVTAAQSESAVTNSDNFIFPEQLDFSAITLSAETESLMQQYMEFENVKAQTEKCADVVWNQLLNSINV